MTIYKTINRVNLVQPSTRVYANNGQHAEYVARFTLTGSTSWADNVPAHVAADCQDIQIKSQRASICRIMGYDIPLEIAEHLKNDRASRYGYVTKDFQHMYIMSPTTYLDFVRTFGTLDRDSTGARGAKHTTNAGTTGGRGGSNGGRHKWRLKRETPQMLAWLEERTR